MKPTVNMRSMVLSCTAPESKEKARFPTERRYAVDCSKNPMTESTNISIGSDTDSTLDDVLLFLLFGVNIRVIASMQTWRIINVNTTKR
jgi:hypothetical protein